MSKLDEYRNKYGNTGSSSNSGYYDVKSTASQGSVVPQSSGNDELDAIRNKYAKTIDVSHQINLTNAGKDYFQENAQAKHLLGSSAVKEQRQYEIKRDQARKDSLGRGETGLDWYGNASTEYDAAERALEMLKEKYGKRASDEEAAEIEAAAKRLGTAKSQKDYASYFRYADITNSADYKDSLAKGQEKYSHINDYRQAPLHQEGLQEYTEKNGNSFLDKLIWAFTSPGTEAATPMQAMADYNATTLSNYQDDNTWREPTDNWTDEQRNIYYYLLGRSDTTDEADEYATQINNAYNSQEKAAKQKALGESATSGVGSGALHTAASIGASLASGADFFRDALEYGARGTITEKSYMDPTDYSTTVQSAVASAINKNGPKIGSNGFTEWTGLAGKGFGDAYQIATSIMQSWASIATGGEAGSLAMFFGSAAAQGVNDALARGIDPGDAIALGFCNGLAEVAGEKFSVENLINMRSSTGLGAVLRDIAIQAGIESSEEGFTTGLNTLADMIINGDKSEYNQNVNTLMAKGMSYEDAKKQATKDYIAGLSYDMISGAVSGGFSAAGKVIGGQTINRVTQYRGDNAQQIIDEAMLTGDQKITDRATAAQSKLNSTGTISNYTAERLSIDANNALNQQDTATLANRVQDRLEALGESKGTAQDTAIAVARLAMSELGGEELSAVRKATLRNTVKKSTYGQRVLNELNIDNIAEGTTSSNWTKEIGTKRAGGEYYGAEITKAGNATTSAGKKIGSYKAVDVKDGKIVFETDGGEKISSADMRFANSGEARVYQTLEKMGIRNTEDINYIASAFRASGMDGAVFARGVNNAFNYGSLNLRDRMMNDDFAAQLPESIRNSVYDLGAKTEAETAKNLQESIEAKRTEDRTIGKVHFETQTERKNWNAQQKAGVDAAEMVSKLTGKDIHIFESYKNSKGEIVYKDAGGKEVHAPNGWFDTATGEIWIDLNAGANQEGLVLNTLAHELTHFIKEYAPGSFQQFAETLLQYMGEKTSLDDLVQRQIDLARESGRSLSLSEAREEVIANACDTLLNDGNALKVFTEMQQDTAASEVYGKDFWSKVRKFVQDFMKKLKGIIDAYKGVNSQSMEGRIVQQMTDVYQTLQQTWAEALNTAAENAGSQASDTENVNINIDEKTDSANPLMFSERTWTESEYVQQRDKAAAELAEAIGISVSKAKAYIDSINSVAKAIADDRMRLDYQASEGVSALVGNTEYGGSVDFSTICKKRRLLTGTFTAIQNALPNTALTADEILTIRKMMKDKGYEVSCGLCYVEGSRAKMGEYAKQFLDEFAKTNPDYLPNMSEINTPEGIEKIRTQYPDVYDAYEKFMNGLAQRKPKLYQMATEYQNEILNKFKNNKAQVEKYNYNGGLRLQSFSDFEIIHLIDNMQVIMDMAKVGLAGQAYTKVPEFAWAMGKTGLKINLSLIAKDVVNGKLVIDEVEGMKRADAEALRNAYSDNVGTILVVFTDEQLKAALADDFIDYIIPFHRSQWNSQQYSLMGLPENAKDFTKWQNESFIEPVYNKNGKKTRPSNYMPNGYWDFSRSGKENAEAYLKMCAQNNRLPKFSFLLDKNSDGSYSLKKDGSTDGYWKLLIDFKMYNNDGVGVPQQPVQPIFNEGSENDPHTTLGMLKAYEGGHQKFPVAQDIVDQFVDEYKKSHPDTKKFSDRYNPIREQYAKKGLDELSEKLGNRFPLSANFESTIVSDNSELFKEKIIKGSVPITGKYFSDAAKAFQTAFGTKTTVHIKSIDIDAGLYKSITNESISKEIGNGGEQIIIDIIPHLKDILENGKLFGIERIYHNVKKGTALYGYRIYSAYDYNIGTKEKPVYENRAICATIVQTTEAAEAYVFRDIKNVAINHSLPTKNGSMPAPINDNIDTVSQLYKAVKKISRDEGGLKYTDAQKSDYLFNYKETNSGKKYSDRITQAAVDHFGTTEDFAEAGYILTDGQMLDFSGRHWGLSDAQARGRRDVDHEDIYEAYEEAGEFSGGDTRWNFIRKGNIRFSPEAPGINLSQYNEPTAEQYDRIRNFIREERPDSFWVDLEASSSKVFDTDHWLRYNGNVNADKVVNDMKYWYQNKKLPEQSVVSQFHSMFYSERYNGFSDRELLADALEESAINDVERDYIRRYKKYIQQLDTFERNLATVNENLQTETDKNRIQILKNQKQVMQGQIDRMDQKLFKIVATQPMKNFMDRQISQAIEKEKAAGTQKMAAERRRSAESRQALIDRMNTERRNAVSNAVTRERDRADQKIADLKEKSAAALAKEKERSAQKLQDLKEHNAEVNARARDRRNESAGQRKYRDRIEQQVGKLSDMLLKNSDKQHVPEILKKVVLDFVTSIDFSSSRSLAGGKETQNDLKFRDRMQMLQNMLKNQTDFINGDQNAKNDLDGYLDLPGNVKDFLDDQLNKAAQYSAGGETYTVNDMSAEDLRSLSELLEALSTSIRNTNILLANARYTDVREGAAKDIEYMDRLGKAGKMDSTKVSSFLKWEEGIPYYVFKRFGNMGSSIFDSFTKGWEKLAFNAQELINFTNQTYTKKEVQDWKKQIHDITLEDGSQIRMTTAQLMEFSQLLGREQAMKHIEAGGIRIGTIKQKVGSINDTEHYHLTANDISNMLGLLTDRQMEVATKMRKFMGTRGGEWGNEVSMKRFGYEFYTEGDKYYTIKTDANDRPMQDTDAQQNSMFRLLNLSASKSLNPHANNALIVNDIFDTFADHMSDMAKLNALGLPILDAIKWFNYREKIDTGNGTFSTKTLQASMEKAFGPKAQDYFKTLMKDINGIKEVGDRGTLFNRMFVGNYKAAAVGANLRVALLQPTSYVRALATIKPAYLIAAFGTKNGYKEAMKYSGTAVWKSLGYYDTNIARSLRDQIEHNETAADWLKEKSMILAEKGDQITWGRLWNACKLQAKAQNKNLTGEDLMHAAADIFRETIYASQVMDGTLSRSEIMRGSSAASKAITAFMAEPTLSYNILLDAYSQYQLDVREKGRPNAWQRNKDQIANAIIVYMASAAASAIAESLWDAVRDDDDYETYMQKVLQALLGEENWWEGNLAQDILVLGKIPGLKDIISNLQGMNSGENMNFAAISNAYNAFQIWRETIQLHTGALDKATKITYYGNMQPWGKIYKTLQAFSQFTGFAASNFTRDLFAIWNSTAGAVDPRWKVKTYDAGAQKNVDYALEDGTITPNQAIEAYVNDAGMTRADAEALVEYKMFQKDNPDLDVSQKELEYYNENLKGRISVEDFDMYMNEYGMTESQIKEYFENFKGKLSVDEFNRYVNEYGLTQNQIKGYVTTYKSKVSIDDFAEYISETDYEYVKKYFDKYYPAGLNFSQSKKFDAEYKKLQGVDADGDGKTDANSLRDAKIAYLAKLPYSYETKLALFQLDYTSDTALKAFNEAVSSSRSRFGEMTEEDWDQLTAEINGETEIEKERYVSPMEYDQDYISRGLKPGRQGERQELYYWDPQDLIRTAKNAPNWNETMYLMWQMNPDYEGQSFSDFVDKWSQYENTTSAFYYDGSIQPGQKGRNYKQANGKAVRQGEGLNTEDDLIEEFFKYINRPSK